MRSNKKILHYVAPSDLSLGRANSVHVMKMCNAINNKQSIKLFALSSRDMKNLHEFYNSSSNFQIKTFNFLFKRFHGFYVSIAHLLHCFYKREIPDFIITRSPYTAIFWSHHKKLNILYEAHNNLTNLQARFFKIFCKRNKVKLIVISESLGKSFRNFIEQKIFNEI